MATTELISIPTGLIFLRRSGHGLARPGVGDDPDALAIAFLWNFAIGGITGIYLSDVPADIQLHGGMFVTAHFHYTIVGGALMGFFAALYFWFPKMTGRMLDEKLGWISFWLIQVGFNVAFLSMFVAGLQGMPRRVADYDPIFATSNFITSIFAYVLIGGVAITFYNVVISWIGGREGGRQSLEQPLTGVADGHPGSAGELRDYPGGHQLAVQLRAAGARDAWHRATCG